MKKIFLLFAFVVAAFLSIAQQKKILIVSTNIDTVGTNASGTYLQEIAFPFKHFSDNGIEIDIVTPKGGKAAIYGTVSPTLAPIANNELFIRKTNNTLSPSEVKPKDYIAVFYPGGHGQYFDVVNDERIAQLTTAIYENKGIVATAGHGVASLINVRLSNGKFLVDGKRITCFPTWAEKKWMNISNYGKLLAFDMQEVLGRRGAILTLSTFETSRDTSFTNITDKQNRIITGAFAFNAQWAAEETVRMIGELEKRK